MCLILDFNVLYCLFDNISKKNVFVFMGNISYGVYLVHFTILDLAFYILSKMNIGIAFSWLISIIVTIILSIAFGLIEPQLNKLILYIKNKVD